MTILLTPELEQLINEKLATGPYHSVEEVLSAALDALERQATIAAIAEGYEDVLAGRVYTLEEANAEFYKNCKLTQPE